MATARLGNVSMPSARESARLWVSWITVLNQGNLFAPMTFECSCNRDLFQMWLEECLLPQLQPGDVIIIDNARHFSDDSITRKDAASFNHSQAIEEIVAEARCELW